MEPLKHFQLVLVEIREEVYREEERGPHSPESLNGLAIGEADREGVLRAYIYLSVHSIRRWKRDFYSPF